MPPTVDLRELDLSEKGHKGLAVSADLSLEEGQVVWFVLRIPPAVDRDTPPEAAVGVERRPYDDPFLTKVRFVSLAVRLRGSRC